jgi:cell division GTPase FtsZ
MQLDPSVVTAAACMQVMGVGGGGSNAVNRMLANQLTGVEMYVLNTDAQVSACSRGLGCHPCAVAESAD